MMRRDTFLLGIIAVLLVPWLYIRSARPEILGSVCILSVALLVAGLYSSIFQRPSWGRALGQTAVAFFVTVLISVPLYQVAFAWSLDAKLSDSCAGNIGITSGSLVLAAPLVLWILKMKDKKAGNQTSHATSEAASRSPQG